MKMNKNMITIKINNELSSRVEQLNGVDHTVFPVIMINEGVHNRVFYHNAELERSAHSWNNAPVPIHHPTKDGKPISCNSPEIHNKQVIGNVFNTRIENNNLKAELYLNNNKVNSIMPDLFTFLENDGKMDVSTGLFCDDIHQGGEFNGEEYDSIAVNIRPDHLAILPGERGACSWEDGCGIRSNKNNKKGGKMKSNRKKKNEEETDFKKNNSEFLVPPEDIDSFKVNEADYEQVLTLVYRKLDAMDIKDEKHHYPVKVFTDRIIYRVRFRNGDAPKLMQRSYSLNESEDGIIWTNDPVEVVRNETFTPKNNKENDMGDEIKTMKECCPETVKEFIKQNSKFKNSEDVLMGMDEDQFKMIVLSAEEPKEKKKEPKANKEEPKTISFDEIMAMADEETRESIAMGKKALKANKDKLISKIKANKDNSFSDEDLEGFDMEMLTKLASLSGETKVNVDYGMNHPIATNTSAQDEVPVLPDPTFDYKEE